MTALSGDEIALVRSSHAMATAQSTRLAETFYQRLFAVHPGLRTLFPEDMKRQERALADTLAVVVAGLDDLAPLLPTIADLARRHVGYGVVPAHYAVVGATLIAAFDEVLGDRFTAPMRAAWEAAYGIVSTHMIASAYHRPT